MTTSADILTLAASWNWSNFVTGLSVVGFGFVCVMLVLAILIQKPQGGGLSGAFGAGASGSGQTAFGTKTGDALTWMTIIIFVVFLGSAIGMNYSMRPAVEPASGGSMSAPPKKGPEGSTGDPANGNAPQSAPKAGDKPAPPAPSAEKPAESGKTPESNVVIPVKPDPAKPAETPTPGTSPAAPSPAPSNPPATNPGTTTPAPAPSSPTPAPSPAPAPATPR